MKLLRFLLFLIALQHSIYNVAQTYKLYGSDARVYYKVGTQWKRVYHSDTSLSLESVIKSDKPFSVIEDKKNGIVTKCSAEPNGKRLAAIIAKGYTSETVTYRTAVNKGENLSLDSLIAAESLQNLPVNLHYLLVGIHHFDDTHFSPLPLSKVNVVDISGAIENVMVPFNKYLLGYHQTLYNEDQTRFDKLDKALTELADSLKPHNNDMVLLYLSSHGVIDQESQFHLITSDSQYDSIGHRYLNTFTAARLNEYVNRMAVKGAKVLVFVDACYSGTIIRDIGQMDGRTVYFMSTENDRIANEDNDKGSPFCRALAQSISGAEQVFFRENNHNTINAINLRDYLYQRVKAEFNDQTPQSYRNNFDGKQKLWKIPSTLSVTIDSLQQEVYKGKTSAMVLLGDIYFKGSQKDSVEKDTVKALELYRYASEWDDSKGTCRIGQYYYYDSLRTDYQRAFEFFNKAAAAGDDLGKYYLSTCYFKGRGTTPNKKMAKKVFKKIKNLDSDINAAIVKEGVFFPIRIDDELYTNAYVKDGEVFYEFKGNLDPIYDREHRPDKYVAYVKSFAQSGDASYQAELGRIYIYGSYNQRQNYQEGFYWFNESANQGNKNGLFGVGFCLYEGLGTEKDYKKAAEYFQKAASKGHVGAYYNLGILYQKGGFGIEKDWRIAYECFSKSATKGDDFGMLLLGQCYKEGISVKKDDQAAFKWFLKAAKKGNDLAQYLTGMAYLLGQGTQIDSHTAYNWLKKAETANNSYARKALDKYFWADGSPKED